jgi:hypothetical protein
MALSPRGRRQRVPLQHCFTPPELLTKAMASLSDVAVLVEDADRFRDARP